MATRSGLELTEGGGLKNSSKLNKWGGGGGGINKNGGVGKFMKI